jgi:hypothetical protein
MTTLIDDNIWGIIAMPIGISVCFGPALICWLIEERRQTPAEPATQTASKPKPAPKQGHH